MYVPILLLSLLPDRIISGESIDVYNHGNMKRDFTYIDDIVYGVKSALEKNFSCEIFNLGNNKSEKLMDLINYIEKGLNVEANINFLPIQPGDVENTCADIKNTQELLNFKCRTDLKDGLENFINWFKEYKEIK